jgi:hypothetical protein
MKGSLSRLAALLLRQGLSPLAIKLKQHFRLFFIRAVLARYIFEVLLEAPYCQWHSKQHGLFKDRSVYDGMQFLKLGPASANSF